MNNLPHNTLPLEAITLLGTVLPVENSQIPMEDSTPPFPPQTSPMLSPPVLNTGLAIGVIFALSYFVKALSVLVHPPR